MFTGIIEELGIIESIDKIRQPALFVIRADKILEGLKIGDSVSVNGVCLTVVKVNENCFSAEAIEETLRRTTLGNLARKEKVNLEGALKAGAKISGHFVTGHIDGVAGIIGIKKESGSILFEFTPLEKATDFSRWPTDFQADGGLMPPSAQTVRGRSSLTGFTADRQLLEGMVLKGSVAVDGISLTIAGLEDSSFSIYIIPHTSEMTTLGHKKPYDKVNVELDILGKFVRRPSRRDKSSVITEEFLREEGFL